VGGETVNAIQSFLKPRVFSASLGIVATNYALRCDVKHFDTNGLDIEQKIREAGAFEIGEFLPAPFVKGIQPEYLDNPLDDSVPVINTLSIQNLEIHEADCRHITRDDFDSVSSERKPKGGDVLLTVDGGVSIGKLVLFGLSGDFTIDSHVVILRPIGLSPLALVYLLASPLGQMQFKRAESGASGQTTVTEEDVRRFIFPRSLLSTINATAARIEASRREIIKRRHELEDQERSLWKELDVFSV
jgi:hypothetical protein